MKETSRATSWTRRAFVARGAGALAAAALAERSIGAQAPRRRVALVGTGARGSGMWGRQLLAGHGDRLELVSLCDVNAKRADVARRRIGCDAPTFTDLEAMLRATRPETVIVASVDSAHAEAIVRALDFGCDVITEKPLCTDELQLEAIFAARARTGRDVTVAFNARHFPEAMKVRELLQAGAIGTVLSVDFHEYLDTTHGADYFRRWHRLASQSGTLLVHKASHHFDQANWWLDAAPVEVSAMGALRVYGRNGAFRSTHCRGCPHQGSCDFYFDITQNPGLVDLYVDTESEDGYLRDGCVFREDIDIHDTMSVTVRYDSGALLTYTANAFLPYEGQTVAFNGTRGRLDYESFFVRGEGGHRRQELRLTPAFGTSRVIDDLAPERAGTHGGADPALLDMLFGTPGGRDPLGLMADLRAGALSTLVGIAARRSIEQGGRVIRIADLWRG